MQDNNQIEEIMMSLEEDLQKSVDFLKGEYGVIRAGRANPHILDRVTVDYYGSPTPLSQLANMSVQEARLLVVSLFDISQIKAVTKALAEADLGVNISDDGRVIRLAFPALTEERRKELSKQVREMGEDAKVALRNIRRDANDKCKDMKKASEMTEDEQKISEKEIQDLTDKYIKEVDKVSEKKKTEIMEI